MTIPDRASPLADTLSYILSPMEERKAVFYDHKALAPTRSFSDQECQKLTDLMDLGSNYSFPASKLHSLLTSLSWASSYLESDNVITRDEAIRLMDKIQNGQDTKEDRNNEDLFLTDWAKVTGRSEDSSRLIANHRRAINYMIEHPEISEQTILDLHRRLTRTPQMGGGITHFLPLKKRGKIRTYSPEPVYIGESRYMPPDPNSRGGDFIEKEFRYLVESCHQLSSPIDQAFYLLTRIPYLQVFYDGNRRTSRLAANIPLIKNHFCPISFINFSRDTYRTGIISFYELQDDRFMKAGFVKAAITSHCDYFFHRHPHPESLDKMCKDIMGQDYVDPDVLLNRVRERKDKKAGLLPASPGTP